MNRVDSDTLSLITLTSQLLLKSALEQIRHAAAIAILTMSLTEAVDYTGTSRESSSAALLRRPTLRSWTDRCKVHEPRSLGSLSLRTHRCSCIRYDRERIMIVTCSRHRPDQNNTSLATSIFNEVIEGRVVADSLCVAVVHCDQIAEAWTGYIHLDLLRGSHK